MRPELHLRRKLALLPAGEKVPVGHLARLLSATQTLVLEWLQWLVDQGMIDRQTLRPFDAAPAAAEPERRVPLGDRRFRENRPRTFDEQLDAVRNGAPITEQQPIRRTDPERTLGGVVGEIL